MVDEGVPASGDLIVASEDAVAEKHNVPFNKENIVLPNNEESTEVEMSTNETKNMNDSGIETIMPKKSTQEDDGFKVPEDYDKNIAYIEKRKAMVNTLTDELVPGAAPKVDQSGNFFTEHLAFPTVYRTKNEGEIVGVQGVNKLKMQNNPPVFGELFSKRAVKANENTGFNCLMVMAKNQTFVTVAVFHKDDQKVRDFVDTLVIGRHYILTNFKVNPQDQERKLKRVNADYRIVLDIDYPPVKLKELKRVITDRKPSEEQKSFYTELTPSKEAAKMSKPKAPKVEYFSKKRYPLQT